MEKQGFTIELLSKNWLFETDSEHDLCAHGQLRITIGSEIVVDKSKNDWCISASAQHLLRTLDRNHTKENSVGDHLVPCCGHFLAYDGNMTEVYIGGCISGHNWEVRHKNDFVKLKTENNLEISVLFKDYKSQILKFVDEVEKFYNESPKKILPEDEFDKKGYIQFWKEWKEKRDKWRN